MFAILKRLDLPLNLNGDFGYVYVDLTVVPTGKTRVFKASVLDRNDMTPSLNALGARLLKEEVLDSRDEAWEVMSSVHDSVMNPRYTLRKSTVYFAVEKVSSTEAHVTGVVRLQKTSKKKKKSLLIPRPELVEKRT